MSLIDVDEGSQTWLELQVLCKYDPDITKRDDITWQRLSEQWLNAKEALQAAKEAEQHAREALILESQSKSSKGHGVKVEKIIRKGSVPYSEICKELSINVEVYRKPPTESWRITNE